MVFGSPYRSETMPADPHNAQIVSREALHDGLAVVRIAPKEGLAPEFQPGQYTNLGLPVPQPAVAGGDEEAASRKPGRVKLIRRAYSIASPPRVRDYLEFFIVRVDNGRLTPSLLDMEVGDELFMDTKARGHFTLDGVPEGRDLVLISTGTGLAPYLSMLHEHRGTGRWGKIIIIHGVRLAEDLGYRQELESIAAEDESVVYIPMCTREPEGTEFEGLRGRINSILTPERFQELTGVALSPDNAHVYLCGNPAMIDQAEGELNALGFVTKSPREPEGTLIFERYW